MSSRAAGATLGIELTACASICGVAAARSKLPSTSSNNSVAPTLKWACATAACRTAHAAKPNEAAGAPSAECAGAPRALGSKSVESGTLAPSDMLSATATHSCAFGCHDAAFPMESKRVRSPLSTTDRRIAAVVARSSPAAALRHANSKPADLVVSGGSRCAGARSGRQTGAQRKCRNERSQHPQKVLLETVLVFRLRARRGVTDGRRVTDGPP